MATFNSAQFSGRVNFSRAKFSKNAQFWQTQFSGNADFNQTHFSMCSDFEEPRSFCDDAYKKSSFYTDFVGTKFKDSSVFGGCQYYEKIIIDGVTGFSKMQTEWVYDPERYGLVKDDKEVKKRGLKGHLKYDETFFIALIKNYRDMGWFTEADDSYYTYRVEKRKHLLESPSPINFWEKLGLYGEFLLLDFTFGYGVKPLKILRTFLILLMAFSFYYVGFLRSKYGERLPWWKARNPIYKPSRFAWALFYSFDKLTPAIKFKALETLNPNVFIKQKSKRVIYVERFQNLLGWYWFALFLILFSRVWIR